MAQGRNEPPKQDALRVLAANLWQLPGNLRRSYQRRRTEARQRTPVQTVAGNIFLHIHSGKVHRHSLRWYYSFGLGVMSVAVNADASAASSRAAEASSPVAPPIRST